MQPVVLDYDKNVLFPDTSRVWAYDDIKDWGEDVHCEILNGELYMSPTPTPRHQYILMNLVYAMHGYVKANKLGKVLPAPLDTRFSQSNVLQPDILFISGNNKEVKIEGTIIGSPDLVVEIISPSSIQRDYHKKKEIYEKFRVKEYWIVDPGNKAVEIFALNTNNTYDLIAFAESPEKKVFSKILSGFEITLAEIFEE